MSGNDDERFDAILLSMAQQISQSKGPGLDPILDTFFGFLRRRTDFFTGAEPTKIRSKLDEHVNKQMRMAKDSEELLAKAKKQKEEQSKKASATAQASSQPLKTASGASSKVSIEMVDEPPAKTTAATVAPVETLKSSNASETKARPNEEARKPAEVKEGLKKRDGDDQEEEVDEEDKGKLKPNEGNGADMETYTWTQTLKEANVQIPLPSGTSSKQVVCEITRNSLTAGLKNAPRPVLKGKLFADVRPDECHWTIEDVKGVRTLCIHLDKVSDMQWWGWIVEGEPAINTKKVTPENSKLSDLDGETRQIVEKMMFDQRQKAMGKPTSEEIKKMEMLEKLQKANPNLDFSKVKLDGGFSGNLS